MNSQKTADLIAQMQAEADASHDEGSRQFDGSSAWKEFVEGLAKDAVHDARLMVEDREASQPSRPNRSPAKGKS